MSVKKGDVLDIKVGSSIIASGITDKDVSFHGDLIEITDGESSGWKQFADVRGTRAITVSFQGYAYDNTIRTYFLNASALIASAQLLFADAATISGTIAIMSYSESHKIGKLVEFKAELTFSGQPTIA